ncbi:hypothetical protein M3Y96_00332000 [Aphelenchoides besseyi]|nr:hypothetical protein M3Y96_00332000 [Aphelenchoides besseyi]
MNDNQFPNDLVNHCHSNLFDHLRKVGEWFRDEYNYKSRRLTDIQLRMNGQDEYLHSAVALVHSTYLRKLLASQKPPIIVDISRCNAKSVSKVIEWIYNGEALMHQQTIAEDLEATAFLGVDALHYQLQCTFYQMSFYAENRIPSLNIAMIERYGIYPSVRRCLLADVARVADQIPTSEIRKLSLQTITAITGCREVSPKEKIALLKLVVRWYDADENLQHMTSMISNILSNLVNNLPDESQRPTLSIRSSRTVNQPLITARLFSPNEVVEYKRLPSNRDLFLLCNCRSSQNDQWAQTSSRGLNSSVVNQNDLMAVSRNVCNSNDPNCCKFLENDETTGGDGAFSSRSASNYSSSPIVSIQTAISTSMESFSETGSGSD